MDNYMFNQIEETALKHKEELIDDKQLIMHFRNTASVFNILP